MVQSYDDKKISDIIDGIYKNLERMSKNRNKKLNRKNSNKRKK